MAEIETQTNGNHSSVVVTTPPSGEQKPEAKKDEGRPTWLPDKFKTPEDMAKSYTELEKQFTKTKQGEPKPDEKPTEAPKTGLVIPEVKDAEAAVKAAGLDMPALEQEFAANGNKLSEDSMKKLASAGITKEKLDIYVRGMEAKRADFESAILTNVEGGAQKFQEAAEWASKSLDKTEVDAFNRAVSQGDPKVAALAVDGLMARFTRAQGPQLVDGNGPYQTGGDVFRSRAQMTEAMSDPKYKKDPAYRKSIEDKIMRSDFSKFSR